MLHRQLLDRLLIVATAVAAWALAAPAVEAARADATQVTVIAPGGTQQTLALEALAGGEDVVERPYLLRTGTGESTQVVSGFSLAALLEAAGADPYSFSYLEVLRPAGGAVLLSSDQALEGGSFADGPPVVYATAAGTAFLRPSSGSGDLNASDSFEAPQGVTIALRKGSPLQVRAEASTLRTRPGEVVEFRAEAEGAEAGETFAYAWHFDDGGSATGPTATHSFARPGSYDVVVGVTTPGDSTGASAVVRIQVGPPPAGPDRKGGGKRHDPAAPDHGAATTGDGAPEGPPPAPGPASASTAGSHGMAEQRRQSRRPRPRPRPPAPAGEVVTGRLLSTTVPPAPAPQAQPGARTGRPDGDGNGGLGLSGTALGLVVTAGLMGAGALTEARSLLR
jgi:hypothetical protein